MAQAQSIRFGKQALLLGNGATPTEVFSAPCGFEQLTMTVNVATNDTNIPDCDDPDLVAWLETETVSKQMRLSGSGLLDQSALTTWQAWWFGDVELKNVRWFRDLTSPNRGYFQAPAVLTNWQEQGQRGQKWQASVEIAMNGKPTWTAL